MCFSRSSFNKTYRGFYCGDEAGRWFLEEALCPRSNCGTGSIDVRKSLEMLGLCSRTGMPVHYLSVFGKYLGSALPGYSRNGSLQVYAVYHDIERRLALVRRSSLPRSIISTLYSIGMG